MPARTYLTARWILPIDQVPIAGGWIAVADHRILGLGRGQPPEPAHDLGDVAILPGLVNAHTHLELSWMEGRVPPATSFTAWLRALVLDRRATLAAGDDRRASTARTAVAAARASGTVLVGDISNRLETLDVIRDAGLSGVVFHEIVGYNTSDPVAIVREAWERVDRALPRDVPGDSTAVADLRGCVVAHAPYSVLPSLFSEIARRHRGGPVSIHLAESADEVEFLRTGGGPFRAFLEEIGAWNNTWIPPECAPVDYLSRVGYLQPGMLAVHAVQLGDDQLQKLRRADAVIVTCPRSNAWVGAGLPNVSRFYASGVRVAIGTDSLASVATLNMFDELAELRRIAPDVAAASLLESATRIGAEALGFGGEYGTIAPGRRAAFAAVTVPSEAVDVEEYLVSGVPPSAVQPMWY